MPPTTLEEQLIRDEGLRLKPYKDSVGKLTIGVGRNLDDVGISREEATQLLANDIERAAAWVRTNLPWTLALDEVRQAALKNMAFNLGSRLGEFRKFLAHLEAREYEQAAKEMTDSVWATQTGPRAQRLAEQIRSGEWM
jgi:lysozyme